METLTKKLNILILCTGNSARSIIAEELLNHLGSEWLTAYSAGSKPTGQPNPFALQVLKDNGVDTSSAQSKSWDVFADDDAPAMDLIITVCGNAAGEVCPVWPGHPSTAHWGVEDPAAATGSDMEKRQKFNTCYEQMKDRITAFINGLENGDEPRKLSLEIEQRYPDKRA
ncbi:MAG: arsenate reductase ArsC [Candidatus Puniceispirillales bacterium]